MNALFDLDILEAAINMAIDHPPLIPELLAANGCDILDVGESRLHFHLLKELADAHTRNERLDREVLTSRLSEASGCSRVDCGRMLDEMRRKGTPGAYPLFTRRLAEVRFKRRIAEVGKLAEDGTKPSHLIERIETAKRELEGSAAAEPLVAIDFSVDWPATPGPLVGDGKQQLIMPAEKTGIASDSGVGKTQLCSALALGIVSGRPVLGFPSQQQPVVLVSSDGDPALNLKICRQWEGMGGARSDLALLPLYVVSDEDFCLEDTSCFARTRSTLQRAGAEKRPVTFILESLATNVRDTDLRDQVAVRRYTTERFGALMAAFPGLTCIFTCHLRKIQQGSANDLGTRIAGSIQIRAACDSIIGLTVAGKDRFIARRVKRSRSGGDFEPFRVAIAGDRTAPLVLRNEGPADVTIAEVRGAARAVVDFMRAAGGRRLLKEIVAGCLKFSERAVQDACKRLSECDRPTLVRTGGKPAAYDLTPNQGAFDLDGLG
jgi:hypothetical protein